LTHYSLTKLSLKPVGGPWLAGGADDYKVGLTLGHYLFHDSCVEGTVFFVGGWDTDEGYVALVNKGH